MHQKRHWKKHQKTHLKTLQIVKNHQNWPQKGRAGANLPPGPPKVQKLSENGAPEGTPGTPQGTLKSSKSGKKSHPKIIIFPNPLWEGFRTIFELKNGAKMSLKWGLRRQRERKQQKLKKPQICNTFHKKHLFFKVWKHTKSTKTSKNACKERSSHKGDPPEAIFHDFASILELPGEPEMILKQPKEESEKKTQKTPLRLTATQRAGDGN